jgi:hypothetical protein
MSKVAIIGNGGGGKSTLAIKLGKALGIDVHHIDKIHYWWAIKRQITSAFGSTPDRPDNCPLLPKTWEMMKVLWMVHHQVRPQLLELIDRYRADRRVITLTSRQSLRQFIRTYCEVSGL